jgi:hypothetical protein
MHRGHILLHRKIVDWEWYSDANTMRLFVHLLITANWEPKKWKGIPVNRGQRITSLGKLAEELNLSVKQIRVSLAKLNRAGDVASRGASNFTTITLINYDLYQDHEKIRASKRASNGANEGQTKGKRRATTKPLETLQSLESFLSPSKDTITKYNIAVEKKTKKKAEKSEREIIEELKTLYPQLDVDLEAQCMRSWLSSKPGRRFTKKFAVNWLNKSLKDWTAKQPKELKSNLSDAQVAMIIEMENRIDDERSKKEEKKNDKKSAHNLFE